MSAVSESLSTYTARYEEWRFRQRQHIDRWRFNVGLRYVMRPVVGRVREVADDHYPGKWDAYAVVEIDPQFGMPRYYPIQDGDYIRWDIWPEGLRYMSAAEARLFLLGMDPEERKTKRVWDRYALQAWVRLDRELLELNPFPTTL